MKNQWHYHIAHGHFSGDRHHFCCNWTCRLEDIQQYKLSIFVSRDFKVTYEKMNDTIRLAMVTLVGVDISFVQIGPVV